MRPDLRAEPTAKVAVVGAAGRTGRHLVRELDAGGYVVTAVVRRPRDAERFSAQGITATVGDVEGPGRFLITALHGQDVVVFAATGEYDSADRMLSVDLDGAVKTMDAALSVGATRFVLVSGLGVDDPAKWASGFGSNYIAKHYAERLLMASELGWTVVRPGGLTDEAGTGLFSLGDRSGTSRIPRRDVAAFVVAALRDARSIGQSYDLCTGTASARSLLAEQAADRVS